MGRFIASSRTRTEVSQNIAPKGEAMAGAGPPARARRVARWPGFEGRIGKRRRAARVGILSFPTHPLRFNVGSDFQENRKKLVWLQALKASAARSP